MWKTAGITFGSKLISALLFFLLWVFISRQLGPSERGICGLYLLVISTIIIISDMAGGAAAAYLLQTIPAKNIAALQMKWSLIPVVLVPFLFTFFAQLTFSDAIILSLIGWVHATWVMQQHIWLGEKQFMFFNLMNTVMPLLVIAFFGVVWFGFELQNRYAYLAGLGFAWLLVLLISSYRFLKHYPGNYPSGSTADLFEIFSKGGMNQLGHLASLANNKLVFFVLPATSLGVYANAQSITEAILMVPGSLGQIYYSLAAGKTIGKIEFYKILKTNILLITVGCVILLILPESVWLFLFGSSFIGIKQMLIWFVPGIWFYSFYLIFSFWQSANGKFQRNLLVLISGIVLQLVIYLYVAINGTVDVKMAAFSLTASWILISLFAGITYFFSEKNITGIEKK